MIGTMALLTIYAWQGNGFAPAVSAVGSFLTGNLQDIPHFDQLDGPAFAYMAAMTVMMIVVILPVGYGVIGIVGKPHKQSKKFDIGDAQAPLYALIMGTLLFEELFARQLFIGWLGGVFPGSIAKYVLFFIGNSIWALIHLYNYKDARDRNVLRVLPQFLAGIPLTVVFLQYGFLAALLVHVAYDMLLFCHYKRNAFNAGKIPVIVYNVIQFVVGGIFFAVWDKNPLDILNIFQFDGSYAIAGWGFWQYAVALMMIGGLFTTVAAILLYDYVRPKETYGVVVATIAAAITVGLYTFVYWLSGFGGWDDATRMIIVAMVLILLNMSHSGSALARSFWVNVPVIIMYVGVMVALDNVWMMFALITFLVIVDIPEQFLRHVDTA